MINAAKLLADHYPKSGHSLRSLSVESGIGYKTIHRYAQGTQPIASRHAHTLARIIFSDAAQRKKFLALCAEESDVKDGSKMARRNFRKDQTKIRKNFIFRVLQMDSAYDEHESRKYKYDGFNISLGIWEKATPKDIYLLNISSEFGLIFTQADEVEFAVEKIGKQKGKPFSKEYQKETMADFLPFCRKKGISPVSLLIVAKQEIMTSALLDRSMYESGSMLFLRPSLAKGIHFLAEEYIKKFKKPSPAIIKEAQEELEWISAQMSALLAQPLEVEKKRQELIETMDEIIDSLLPSSGS